MLDDRVQQWTQIVALVLRIARGGADARVGVEHGKVELILVRVEIDEEVVDLVEHLARARIGTIDLVDDNNRGQPALERLSEHETRLRQRPFRRIHEEHHAVDHRERALDLAAEVGVARRVDDVDQQILVPDGRVLRENRDAALTLEIDVVERPLSHALVRAKCTALVQERVDERGLSVIHVRDDGDVAPQRICDRRHPHQCNFCAPSSVCERGHDA